jgi:hypothetical protein
VVQVAGHHAVCAGQAAQSPTASFVWLPVAQRAQAEPRDGLPPVITVAQVD